MFFEKEYLFLFRPIINIHLLIAVQVYFCLSLNSKDKISTILIMF